jgi:hypothetical protein
MAMRKFFLIILISSIGLIASLSGCVPMGPVSSPPKINQKGTPTRTPFLSISTFTPTTSPLPPESPAATFTAIAPTQTETPELTPTQSLTPETTPTGSPSPSPSPSISPKPQNTATQKSQSQDTSGTPYVRVSVTTNCRTGPGLNYSRLSPLRAGQQAWGAAAQSQGEKDARAQKHEQDREVLGQCVGISELGARR